MPWRNDQYIRAKFKRRRLKASACAAVVIVGVTPWQSVAFAQTASQLTPPSFQPSLERSTGFSLPAGTGLTTPAGAESFQVRLSGVNVEGGLSQLAPATQRLRERLVVAGEVSGADVFDAARDLEAAYARAGFVLVRVVLPPQTLTDGSELRLVVIDGFIERIDVEGVPARVRERIASLVDPLVGRRGLTLREIERRVLLSGDTPGVVLRSTLTAGTEAGGTVLVLEARHRSTSTNLVLDNSLSRATGQYTLGLGMDFNSIAGWGELIYFRASGAAEDGQNGFFERYPRNRTFAAGMVAPLWIDGLTLNAEVTDARITPSPQNGFQTTDTFQRVSLRARYALLRGRFANVNADVSLEAQDEEQSLFVGNTLIPLSFDRLRIVRLGADGAALTPWGGTISGQATVSVGLDWLNARSADDATPILPLSRQGADATFEKFDLTLGYDNSLGDHLALRLMMHAQTSFGQPLLRSEQVGIANASGLSAFDAGGIVGDSGYVVRGELSSPWRMTSRGSEIGVIAAPYVFGAQGAVWLDDPTVLEVERTGANAFGVGLQLGLADADGPTSGSLTLEYGRAARDDGASSSERLTVRTLLRF